MRRKPTAMYLIIEDPKSPFYSVETKLKSIEISTGKIGEYLNEKFIPDEIQKYKFEYEAKIAIEIATGKRGQFVKGIFTELKKLRNSSHSK